MSSLEELFCPVDDFCQAFEPQWKRQLLGNGLNTRNRRRSLSLSEMMTILIAVHQSHDRDFKSYYQHHVRPALTLFDILGYPKSSAKTSYPPVLWPIPAV